MLHLLCGKIASGKSTLTAELGNGAGTVVIAEDSWLAALFADELTSLSAYGRCSKKLRQVMGPHVVCMLKAGVSVVLDFPANTVANRAWMRDIIQAAEVGHTLHYLDVPDAVLLERLRVRNASGAHPFSVSEAQFRAFSAYFVPPSPEEGFNVLVHRVDDAADMRGG